MPKSKVRKKLKPGHIFLSEKVLSDAPLSVQSLLEKAGNKLDFHHISSMVKSKLPYLKLSDAKKRTKKKQPFKVLFPSRSMGTAKSDKQGGYVEYTP